MGNHSAPARHSARRPQHRVDADQPSSRRRWLRGGPGLLVLAVALLLPLIPSSIAAAQPGQGRLGVGVPGLGGAGMQGTSAGRQQATTGSADAEGVGSANWNARVVGPSAPGAPGLPAAPPAPGLPALPEATPAPDAPAQTQVAPSGARVVGANFLTPHIVDMFVESPAMGRVMAVKLQLPRDWYVSPARFPTLYLLQGANEPVGFNSWHVFTDAEIFFADKNALVVTPEAGLAALHTDYLNPVGDRIPQWETFHTVELREVLEQFWRANGRYAVGGISNGGYAAMAYAAKHPDMFFGAASYSGYPHSTLPGMDRFFQYSAAQAGEDPNAPWGDPVINGDVWRANDPWWLSENLRGKELFVSAATGLRGEHNDSLPEALSKIPEDPEEELSFNVLTTELEAASYGVSTSFVEKLTVSGIPVTTSFQATGTHIWDYWYEEMVNSWSTTLEPALGPPT